MGFIHGAWNLRIPEVALKAIQRTGYRCPEKSPAKRETPRIALIVRGDPTNGIAMPA